MMNNELRQKKESLSIFDNQSLLYLPLIKDVSDVSLDLICVNDL